MTKYLLVFLMFGALYAHEPLVVKEKEIHTIASFDAVDYFTTITSDGEFLWELPFGTKIESFQELGDRLFILSKMRDGSAYYLTCLDAEKGKLIWEKPIFAPQAIQEPPAPPIDLP